MAETITATELISLYSLTPTRVVVEKLRRITQDGIVYTEKSPVRRIYYNAPYDRSLMAVSYTHLRRKMQNFWAYDGTPQEGFSE